MIIILFGIALIIVALACVQQAVLMSRDKDGIFPAVLMVFLALYLAGAGVAIVTTQYKVMTDKLVCSKCSEQYTDYKYCPIDGTKLEGIE